jgi:hypothetical protein
MDWTGCTGTYRAKRASNKTDEISGSTPKKNAAQDEVPPPPLELQARCDGSL